ncbi:MAG: hypothetical protein M5U16_00005 [Hyphomicrobium sp.]|nr:hypothetical protein [Hyphomicrobium sp.]
MTTAVDGAVVPFAGPPNTGGRIEPVLIVVHFTAGPSRSSVIWVNWSVAKKKSKVS